MRPRRLLQALPPLAASVALALLVSGCAPTNVPEAPRPACVGLVCVETVNVGDVDNLPDTETGHGAVDHEYAIGAYEITVGQYLAFLNAVAALPEIPAVAELWVDEMQDTAGYVSEGLISRTGAGTSTDPYVYAEIVDSALGESSSLRGILNISWFSAARFANWLHNGGTAESRTEDGAYTLDGATSGVILKNADARWWIPAEDEWYKAAYYDPSKPGENKYWTYPTRSDEMPTGEEFPGGVNSANFNGAMPELQKISPVGAFELSRSYYGTWDQAGLLWEWTDAVFSDFDDVPVTRGLRGGSWSLGMINISKFGPRDYAPTYNDDDTGFRLATTHS
jgi:sulfatase modifying factor 1